MCNGKVENSAAITQHDPLEIILILRFCAWVMIYVMFYLPGLPLVPV